MITPVMVETSDCYAAVQISVHVLGDCFSLALVLAKHVWLVLDRCMCTISELKFTCVPCLICLLSLYNRLGNV